MELVHVCLTSLGSIVLLLILTKIMGNRQISQLSLFDYINGITIGSIAAEMAIQLEDFKKPMVAMIIYALVATLISWATCKSVKMRRVITGKPMILFENGKFVEKNMRTAKLDLAEFMTQCRNSGFFNLTQIYTAILEPNGKISFLPAVQQRPTTPNDLSLNPAQEQIPANVIIDGNIMKKNLQNSGKDETWLMEQLRAQGIEELSEVFFATCESGNTLNIYRKITASEQDILS